ncbi:adenylate/guanylate cyclase domain-containing protein [Marinibaculum pumilum]|uniref:Adenylate/guanylate cyclase domain-containing protein n=1 Tax=Marinibaculum pumilum TaxID=1766165 RepID=A0ABV7KWB0_9PROT
MSKAATDGAGRFSGVDQAPPRPAEEPANRRRDRRGLPLSLVVVGGVIGLLVIAMAIVTAVTFAAGLRNTNDLLILTSRVVAQALESRLERELAPAERLAVHAATNAANDPATLAAAMPAEVAIGAMAVLPQVVAVVIDARLLSARAGERVLVLADGSRHDPGSRLQVLLRDLAARSAQVGGAVWGPPTYVPQLGATLLPVVARATRADGAPAAALALVTLDAVVADVAEIELRGGRAFLLYGDDHLIGPPDWIDPATVDPLAAVPLARLMDATDPVMRAMAAGAGAPLFGELPVAGFDGRFIDLGDADEDDRTGDVGENGAAADGDGDAGELGEMLGMGGREYVVLTRDVTDYSPEPLTVGISFRAEDVSGEIERLSRAGMAALAVVLVAALLAYLLSMLITRPVRLFAANARRVAELRLDEVRIGRGDPTIREFREANDAFRRMLHALHWFEAYVPKSLVRTLLQQPDPAGSPSEERVVTVMFTDIRGFTALAEKMSAREAAALLNSHFELVSACVEAEGGTIDKYVGDSVMCFWGAPQQQDDHAARALRTARRIRRAQQAANRQREAEGLPPIALRIGLHTGRAIVGNIGSRSRVNYTLIGDMVNIANRLEALGKKLAPDLTCCILASDAVLRHCGAGFAFRPCGRHALPGRAGMVEVFALL